MTKEEINDYRKNIDDQIKEKVSEIETNISYITIACLGFILTINEKFFQLVESKLILFLILSILSFVICFMSFLFSKHLITKYNRELLDFIDTELEENSQTKDEKLIRIWEKADKCLTRNKNIMYIALVLGIIFEIIYFSYNIKIKKADTNINNEKNISVKIYIVDSSKTEILYKEFNDTIK